MRDGAASVTYASLWNQAVAVARELARRGLEPGDRVAIVLANGSEFVAGYLRRANSRAASRCC